MLRVVAQLAKLVPSLLLLSGRGLAQSSCPACQNGGACQEVPNSPGQYLCACSGNWTGLDCSQAAASPPSSSSQESSPLSDSCGGCLNGGSCQEVYNSPGNYYCQCQAGFVGQLCQTPPPATAPAASTDSCGGCRNGGNCQGVYNSPGSYYCQCTAGFSGPLCDSVSPTASPVRSSGTNCGTYICQNGGTCSQVFNSPGDYQCSCINGWQGLDCTTDSAAASAKAPGPAKGSQISAIEGSNSKATQSGSSGFPREYY